MNCDYTIIQVAEAGFKIQLSWNSKVIIQTVSLHSFEQWEDKHIHSFIKQIGLQYQNDDKGSEIPENNQLQC